MRNFQDTFEKRKRSFISDSADLHDYTFNVKLEKFVLNTKRHKIQKCLIFTSRLSQSGEVSNCVNSS